MSYPKKSMHGLVGRPRLRQRERAQVKRRRKGLVNRERRRRRNKHRLDFRSCALGGYVAAILLYGTTEGYSTQTVRGLPQYHIPALHCTGPSDSRNEYSVS